MGSGKERNGKSLGGDESRRVFIQRAGQVATASALAGTVVPQCHAHSDSTIKLALIGCGGRGTGAVRDAFQAAGGRPIQLHALADVFENRVEGSYARLANQFGEQVNAPPERRFVGFDSYKHAIDSLDPGDVALLTAFANFRPLHFEYAVSRGVHVFAEKSFAVDGPANRRWLKTAELAEQKNIKVACGFMWRHSQARQEVIARIHDGAIGDVHTLRIYRMQGARACPPLPEGAHELEFQLRHPNEFTWITSGLFVDWQCHNVDVACWAKGAWPVSAQALGGQCYPAAGNQFDHFAIEYTFADGTKLFTFFRHINNCWNTYADYAHGSRGAAVIMTSLGQPRSRIYKSHDIENGELAWEFGRNDNNPYVEQMRLLLDAIHNDTPHNEARRAGEANLATLMGRAAAHTGGIVTWDQMRNSSFQFVEDIDAMTFDTPAPIQAGPDGRYSPPLPGMTQEI